MKQFAPHFFQQEFATFQRSIGRINYWQIALTASKEHIKSPSSPSPVLQLYGDVYRRYPS